MRAVLLTGGAGFIGSCLVRQWLAEEDSAVVVLDKLTYAGHRVSLAEVQEHPRFHWVQGDIGDADLVGQLLQQFDVGAIINLAAETHVDRSIDAPDRFVQTNVVGVYRLLEAALRYWRGLASAAREQFRLLHVSTDEVYGSLGAEGRFTEQSPYAPNSPYSASKAAADHFVRAYHRTYGLPTLITNASNNYGPRQLPEKLIPLVILNALDGRPLPIYGDGQQVRDWLYVQDHCRGLRTVLHAAEPGSVYNIGGDCERTNLQVVHAICETVDRLFPELPHRPCRSLIEFVDDRPGHDRRYALDASRLQQRLDWRPGSDFPGHLEQTVAWYAEHRDWVQCVQAGSDLRQRQGLRGVTHD